MSYPIYSRATCAAFEARTGVHPATACHLASPGRALIAEQRCQSSFAEPEPEHWMKSQEWPTRQGDSQQWSCRAEEGRNLLRPQRIKVQLPAARSTVPASGDVLECPVSLAPDHTRPSLAPFSSIAIP